MSVSRETVLLGATGVALIAIGAGCGALGYLLLRKKLEAKYDAIARDEIAKAREFYKVLNKEGELSKPQNVRAEELNVDKIVAKANYGTVEDLEEDLAIPDYKDNINPVPYVISKKIYMENKDHYHQESYTYYTEDDILLDENDNIIVEVDEYIGSANLDKFGHGSNDPNIVYVRNEEQGFEYEVVRLESSYEHEIRGSIKHSKDRNKEPKRFRLDRE